MKAILTTAVIFGLAAGPDYDKWLGEAKFPLSEAIGKGLKEAKEGTILKAGMEVEAVEAVRRLWTAGRLVAAAIDAQGAVTKVEEARPGFIGINGEAAD